MWLEWLSHTLSASTRSAEPRRRSRPEVLVGVGQPYPMGESVLDVAAALIPRAPEPPASPTRKLAGSRPH